MSEVCWDAVDYWDNLGLHIDDERFRRIEVQAQRLGLVLPWVTEPRLLQLFKDNIGWGLENGVSPEDISGSLYLDLSDRFATRYCKTCEEVAKAKEASKQFKALFSDNLSKIADVVRTCLTRARLAGQWRALQRTAAYTGKRYLVRYSVKDRDGPCQFHKQLDRLVIPHDDPIWREYWPPNGPGCTCEVTPISDPLARSMGIVADSYIKIANSWVDLDKDIRLGFSPAEHHLLPYADFYTRTYKQHRHDDTSQHIKNAIEWEGIPGVKEVLRERYVDGVDVFAVDGHNVTSRGQMYFDMAVLPWDMPGKLAGHVVVVSDSVFKIVYRELLEKLKKKYDAEKRHFSGPEMTERGLQELAIKIMKDIPSRLSADFTRRDRETTFFVNVLDEKIWVGFELIKSKYYGNPTHYFEMNKVVFIHNQKELRKWLKSG